MFIFDDRALDHSALSATSFDMQLKNVEACPHFLPLLVSCGEWTIRHDHNAFGLGWREHRRFREFSILVAHGLFSEHV